MSARRLDAGGGRRLLGELLIEAGLVTRDGLEAGLQEQRLRGGRLGFNLLKIGRVTPAGLHLFLQDHFAVLSADLLEAMRSAPAVDRLPPRLAHHYGMVPARVQDGVLDLAVATVDTPELIAAVAELTGLRVEPLVCPPSLIMETLARFYPAEVEPGVIYRSVGDNLLVLSDRRRGTRPLRPEWVREDAPAADWLRAIVAEGVCRRARRIEIEPHPEEVRIVYTGCEGDDSGLSLPCGAYPGVARLVEGMARIPARGRIVPRDGRMALAIDGRLLSAAVLALPGFEGYAYSLDLREDRIASVGAEEIESEVPGLLPALRGLVERGRGLLLLAGPGHSEAVVGLEAILTLLGDRLPRRAALGAWEGVTGLGALTAAPEDGEDVPLRALVEWVVEGGPDLLIMPALALSADADLACAQARERVVIAPVRAADTCAAAEWIVRAGHASEAAESTLAGILAVRLMEGLCHSCRLPYDLHDLISPGPRERSIGAGAYHFSPGCPLCRGSGARRLLPVFEYMPIVSGRFALRPGVSARSLKEQLVREGMPTLLSAALRKASRGILDVKEPLRLLLHEPR